MITFVCACKIASHLKYIFDRDTHCHGRKKGKENTRREDADGGVNEPTAGCSLSSSSSSPVHKVGVDRTLPGPSIWSSGVTTASHFKLQVGGDIYWQVGWLSGRVTM